jgi:hypothetical protein
MRRRVVLALSITALLPCQALASSADSGKVVAIALPVAAGGITLLHDWDWTGVAQLSIDTGLTVGTALILKQIVKEERPDGSNMQSFPSETAAVAFAPAAYLWDRYGWQYGVPAYLAAGYAGYSVINAKEHHWWDVAASAGIAWGYSRIFTTEWHHRRWYGSVYASSQGGFVSFDYKW